MKVLWFTVSMLCCTAALAQAVPAIPFTGSAPLQLPKNVYLGEVTGVAVNAKGHVYVLSRGNTSGPAYAAAAAQLLEFDPQGKFVREIGKNLYAWSFGHTVRVDPQQNIWVTDKGSDMVIKFNPAGTRRAGIRAQAGSLRRGHRSAQAPEPAAPCRGWALPPGHRRHVRTRWQHVHQRRLHQLARRQSRQGRRLAQVLGRSRHQAGRVQHAALDRCRCAGQYLRRRSRQPAHPGVRRRWHVPARSSRSTCRSTGAQPAIGNVPDVAKLEPRATQTMMPGAPWTVCITPGPNQVLYTSDAYPGPHLQALARRQSPRLARRIGQAAQAIRLGARDRVPLRERALRGGAPELAGAEAGAESAIRSRSVGSPSWRCRARGVVFIRAGG